jgi:mannose-6-phosphate isomerase-like protein (cupin superfamily)
MIMKVVLVSAVTLGLALGGAAQQPGAAAVGGAGGSGNPPADAAVVFSRQDLQQQIEHLIPLAKSKGSSGATVEDYGSYKVQLSVRTSSGGAEVHAHWDDVMMVEQGSATLITGGTVLGARTGADGETHGSGIQGGQSRAIVRGDVLAVKAGTPHQLILKPGSTYGAVVVKIHEP